MYQRLSVKAAVLVAVGLAVPASLAARLRADEVKEPAAAAKPSQLARDLVGTWVLAGTPDKPEDPPEKGAMLKFFTGKHWCITQADPRTGHVIYHHGGRYTLGGDGLAETIEYANANTAALVGKTHRFTVKVEGDTYTQVGRDNAYTQRWKRVK